MIFTKTQKNHLIDNVRVAIDKLTRTTAFSDLLEDSLELTKKHHQDAKYPETRTLYITKNGELLEKYRYMYYGEGYSESKTDWNPIDLPTAIEEYGLTAVIIAKIRRKIES